MSAEIHYLYGRPTPITHFLRIGHSGHRQLETLHEAGRLPTGPIVLDAGRYDMQRELAETLSAAGSRIVLDPSVAELSGVGRCEGSCRHLPTRSREMELMRCPMP